MKVSTRNIKRIYKEEDGKILELQHIQKYSMEKSNLKKRSTEKVIYNRFDRKVRESLEIQKNNCNSQHGMNLDNGQYVTHKVLDTILQTLTKYECLTSAM